jgi:hypothetical protein
VNAQDRKERPVYSGVLRYFPKALLEVAHCSWLGNEQHNPGEPLYWNRAKSTDEADALMRHLMQAGGVDSDGVRHTAKVAWRALAMLEKELEAATFEAKTDTDLLQKPEPTSQTYTHATDSDGGIPIYVAGSDDPLDEPFPLPAFGPGSPAATTNRSYVGEDDSPIRHHPV